MADKENSTEGEKIMRGSIVKRGKNSWRISFDLDRENGVRRYRKITVKGSKKDAEAELARLLNDAHGNVLVDPSALTVGAYFDQWLNEKHDLSPVTREHYGDMIRVAIVPPFAAIPLQKLKPAQVKSWLSGLRQSRGPRTVANYLLLLRSALKDAVKVELLGRNVGDAVDLPRAEAREVTILDATSIKAVMASLEGSRLHPVASLALASGLRRNELLALRWSDIDLDKALLRVERSLEQTRGGTRRFKCPKTTAGRRTITLPPTAVAMLREHRKAQLTLRLQLGLGREKAEALVFCNDDFEAWSPNGFSVCWTRMVPGFSFHSLRHTHASALIAGGVDVIKVSRRLGHAKPSFTLNVYSHLWGEDDAGAADAIERLLK
jgi:integrase